MKRAKAKEDAPSTWSKVLGISAYRDAFAIAAMLALLMCAVALFVSWQTVIFMRNQIDSHLLTDARSIAGEPGNLASARLALAIDSDPQKKRIGGIFTEDGRRLSGNLAKPPYPPPASGSIGPVDDPVRNQPAGKGSIRLARIPLDGGRELFFGRRVNELSEIDDISLRTLGVTILLITVLSLIGGASLTRLRVRRVTAVKDACDQIVQGDLGKRIPMTGARDEYGVVAVTINRMLDEIERLMAEMRCAGDAIAHDIRTPLTRLRARLDRISEGDADLPTTRSAIVQTIADVDQLIAMTKAVLRLRDVESGHRRRHFTSVDLRPIVESLADLYTPVAEEKGLALTTHHQVDACVHGDGELLFEAVGNLIDNAIKFTPPPGQVSLRLLADGTSLFLHVSDTGPGIPEEQRAAVLRRFYRFDPSRTTSGNGLGLSIAAAIMQLHEFSLDLGEMPDASGCRVTIKMRIAENSSSRSLAVSPGHEAPSTSDEPADIPAMTRPVTTAGDASRS